MRLFACLLLLCFAVWPGPSHAAPGQPRARRVATPPSVPGGVLYPGNRAPPAPAPLIKLPTGAVTASSWLRRQLTRMADGMTGRLEEISPWCSFDGSAWSDPDGRGRL